MLHSALQARKGSLSKHELEQNLGVQNCSFLKFKNTKFLKRDYITTFKVQNHCMLNKYTVEVKVEIHTFKEITKLLRVSG
jgi:hypothetical protein